MSENKLSILRRKGSRKIILRIVLSLTCLIVFAIEVFPQDTAAVSKEKCLTLSGYVKDMETVVIRELYHKWITNNLFYSRINSKLEISKSFSLCMEERNRFYQGELIRTNPLYKNIISYDNGLINMSWNLMTDKSDVLNLAIDRAWVDYTHNKFQATLGRQRVNWSQTFVWNPNDIFNTYSYFDFDYEEKPGSDALRLQYFTSASSRAEFAVKADKDKKITTAGLYRFNRWSFDLQGLAGIYANNDLVAGMGWAGQIASGGFKGEMTCFRPLRNFKDSTSIFLVSVEYDYTFRNAVFIQFEGFYNSNTNNSPDILASQLNPGILSVKNPFLSGFSVFANISYPLSPLIKISLSGIENAANHMYFIIPDFSLSLTNNIDFTIIAQSYQSYDRSMVGISETSLFFRLKGAF